MTQLVGAEVPPCAACREKRKYACTYLGLRMSRGVIKIAALLALCLFPKLAAGLVSSTEVMGTGMVINSVMPATGLAKGAVVKMSYRFEPSSVPSNSAFLLLVDDHQLQTYYKTSSHSEDEFFRTACNAPSALRVQLSTDGQPGSLEYKIPYMGQFTGLLMQCSGYYSGILRIKVNASTVNPSVKGELVHQLGLEGILLPQVYAALLAAGVILLVVWQSDLLLLRKHSTTIHWAAAAALAIKVAESALKLGYYTRLDRDGTVAQSYSVWNNFVEKMSTISELLILFLLGLGWKVTRSQLTPREVRLLLLAFGFYFVFAAAQAACSADPTPSKMCEAYVLTEYVVHSLILLGIIVSINFNLTHLRATLNDYPWSSNVPLQYQAMKDFQFYRLIFLLYLLLPTILLIVRIMLLSWAYSWLDELIHQGTVLAICVSVIVTFGPYERELYTRPFTPSEQGADPQAQQVGG